MIGIRKFLFIIATVFFIAGCQNEAEKEKHDYKLLETKLVNIEYNINQESVEKVMTIYEEIEKNMSKEEINSQLDDMRDRHIKMIDEEFKDIQSKLGKEIINISKTYVRKHCEFHKEVFAKTLDNANTKPANSIDEMIGFSSVESSPINEELGELLAKETTLLIELGKRVNSLK